MPLEAAAVEVPLEAAAVEVPLEAAAVEVLLEAASVPPPLEAASVPPLEAASVPPLEATPVIDVPAEPPARPASSFTRPEPRPRTGASARVGVTGTRPPTRTAGIRPGPLSSRSERPDPASLTWKPTVPFTVGSYALDTESDLGAYGVTFAGRDGSDPVQVLVFHPAFFSAFRRAANLERLERARRCDHPAIAPVLATGEFGATRWVATRPVGGTPLTHWRRDYGAMPLSETLRVVAQLAEAIEAIHAVSGVHGGLSPETIRFYPGNDAETGARADRVVVVHPFWLDAADVPPAELRAPRTAWLAPELVFGEVADAGADIYGLGLVLGYLLACGMTEPGHSLLVQGIDVPPGLDDVYVIATSRQPEHRFESIAALREALEAAAGDEWLAALERSRHVTTATTPVTARAEVLEVEDADLLEPGAETTDEDQAVPTFPAIADTDERTDTALPAFVIEEDLEDITATGVSELAYADSPFAPELRTTTAAVAGVPPTGRGKRIVVPTLPHGQRSGLLPVAELAPPLLPPEAPVPAIASTSAGAPDTLVRVRAATGVAARPTDLQGVPGFAPAGSIHGPPPLPPGLLQATYSSSLEVLDGPSALPPEGPPAPPFEVLDEEVAAEATLVEPVAPALLAASADILFAEPAPPVLEDAADSLPGASLASLASLIPPPPIDEPVVGSGRTSGLLAAPLTGRGPRIESLPSGPLMPLSAAPSALEPRTLRDPSGVLAGAPVVESAGPTRAGPTLGDLHRAPLSAHIARPVEKQPRRGWMVWAVLAALLVGGVIAFFAFGSESDKPSGPAVAPGTAGPVATPPTAIPPVTAPPEPDVSVAAGDTGPAVEDVAVAAVDTGPTVEDTAIAAVDTTLEDTAIAAVDTAVTDTAVEDTAIAAVDTALTDTAVEDTTVAAVDTAVADTTVAANPIPAHVEMPEIITDPDKLKCPDGMLRMKRKVKVDAPTGEKLDSWDVTCIDRFEYPGGGASPTVGLDLPAARAACTSRGKRLCTRAEWRRACGGNYPYGKDYDAERCNTAGTDGTPKPILAAGTKKGCISPSGAFDMVGNVAEWTSDGFINGGTSLRNADDATCGSASRRAGGAPHVGFRCCADAK